MKPLAPIGGGKKPQAPTATTPTSALAAFANQRESGSAATSVVRPLPPSSSAGAALKPIAKFALGAPEFQGNANGAQPLSALSCAPTPPKEVSALAAFAKKALPMTSEIQPLGDTPIRSVKKNKRPTPLAPTGDSQRDKKENKETDFTVIHEKQTVHKHADGRAEQKEENIQGPPTCKASNTDEKPTECVQPEVQLEAKAGYNSDGDGGDSMAEFACTDSEEEDGEQENGGEVEVLEALDVGQLYDHENREEGETAAFLRAKQRIFTPPTSKVDLFHAILVKDMDLLTHTLSHLTPQDVVSIRDAEGRTMYLYAAMSRSPEVQAVVFDFIHCYLKQETDDQIAAIEAKQRRLGKWSVDGSHKPPKSSEWIPPSVKAIRESSERELTKAYLVALTTCDCNGRSFLHYSALNRRLSPVQVSQALAKVLKANPSELLHKDVFERDALVYAVVADNTLAVRLWFTQLKLGESLATNDIDRLLQFKISTAMQSVLHSLLEECDANRCARKAQAPGLSIHLATKNSIGSSTSTRSSGSSGTRMWTSLHKAVIYGNADAVRHFIDEGVNVNKRDSDGWTPLHASHCSSLGSVAHLAIADILLDHGADVNASSLHGRTPLHRTAMHPSEVPDQFSTADTTNIPLSEDVQCATLLIKRGAKLEVYDEDHYTPFLAAVHAGNIRVTRLLLESNCDASALDKTGGCALHIAVSRGLEEMIRFLCWWDAPTPEWRCVKDYRGRVPMALAKGDSTIRSCLDNLWYSIRCGDVEQVRKQSQLQQSPHGKQERKRNISIHDKTPRMHRTALHLAIEPYMENKRPSTQTPIASAVLNTKVSVQDGKHIVTALLHAGASLAVGDKWGITPLMLAACIESPVMFESLLTFATEEDLQKADSAGNLAIHYSYAFGRVRAAKISSLIEDAMEDNTEMENNAGQRPLGVTGYRDKVFPSDYRDFLLQRHKRKPVSLATSSRQ